jgi:hypothetical protein
LIAGLIEALCWTIVCPIGVAVKSLLARTVHWLLLIHPPFPRTELIQGVELLYSALRLDIATSDWKPELDPRFRFWEF